MDAPRLSPEKQLPKGGVDGFEELVSFTTQQMTASVICIMMVWIDVLGVLCCTYIVPTIADVAVFVGCVHS